MTKPFDRRLTLAVPSATAADLATIRLTTTATWMIRPLGRASIAASDQRCTTKLAMTT